MGTNRVQITDLRPFCNGSWCPSVTLSWSIKDIPHLRVEGSRKFMYILSHSYWCTGYLLQHVQNSSPEPHFHCVCDDDAQRWRTASKAVSQNHNHDYCVPTSILPSSPCWRLLVCCGPWGGLLSAHPTWKGFQTYFRTLLVDMQMMMMMRINDAWVKLVALDHVHPTLVDLSSFLKVSKSKHSDLSISQGVDDVTMH